MSPVSSLYKVSFSPRLEVEKGIPLTGFTFPWKDVEAPATEFRAVWNERVLSFRFVVEDHDVVLPQRDDPGEAALASDRVELFFSPSSDLLPFYYGAEMDPGGRLYDYRASYHRNFDPAWSFETLEFSGSLGEGGYEVTGQIALEELEDLGCLRDGEMITGVYRAEFSHGPEGIEEDWISWVTPESPTPDFHIPSSFGRFRFVPG